MVTRTRNKQMLTRLTTDELAILDDFCEANGITKSRLVYDLIEKIRNGEYEY